MLLLPFPYNTRSRGRRATKRTSRGMPRTVDRAKSVNRSRFDALQRLADLRRPAVTDVEFYS
jgi:hypothetical protein